MSFLVSKFVWALLAPGTLLFLALALAWFGFRRWPRLARTSLGIAAVFVGLLTLTPVGRWLIWPLQSRFPPPLELKLDRVDGVIVLGGAINTGDVPYTDRGSLSEAAERVTALVELARRYPQAKLVYSGGSGAVRGPADFSEADTARPLFAALGVDAARVIYERASRNTWENAVYSKRLAAPQPGEVWLLVTSAWHMPRSVGCFRRAGWTVVPYEVDYRGTDTASWAKFDTALELDIVTVAVREWIGLVSYRLLGRTDAWLPTQENPT